MCKRVFIEGKHLLCLFVAFASSTANNELENSWMEAMVA
jgi:hypothetical protein